MSHSGLLFPAVKWSGATLKGGVEGCTWCTTVSCTHQGSPAEYEVVECKWIGRSPTCPETRCRIKQMKQRSTNKRLVRDKMFVRNMPKHVGGSAHGYARAHGETI